MQPQVERDIVPFAMMFLDTVTSSERGYTFPSDEFTYDAQSQVSNTITMGGTLVLTSFEERDSDTQSDSED